MKLTDALRYVAIGGIFLLPFVPLIVSNSMFFPFITGKNFFFRIVVEIIFAVWILLALGNERYRPRFSWVLALLASFVVVIGVANILGENFFRSFWSNFERMEGYITILHLFAYFLVAGSVLSTERLWSRLAHTSVAVSVLVGLYGLIQIAGFAVIHQGGVRVDASLGNAAYLAAYMLMHLFITGVLLVRSQGALLRGLYASIMALQAFILISTATRGAVLGLLAGVLLTTVLIAIFERVHTRVRWGAFALLLMVAIAVGGFFSVRNTEFVQNDPILSRFSDITLEAGSTRLTIWGMAWQGFLERPILGWGQDSFHIIFNKYYDTSLHSNEPWFDHVHNIVLDWLVAGGIVGAVLYFAVPLAVLYYLWRRQGREMFSVAERSIITGLLAAYFFQNLFVFDNIATYLLYFSLLAYVYVRTKPTAPLQGWWAMKFEPGTVSRVAAPLVGVGLLAAVYFLNMSGIATAQTLIQALSAERQDYIRSLDYFEDLAARKGLGSQEVTEQLTFVAQRTLSADVPDEVKMRAFSLAKQELDERIAHAPNDARLHYFYASLLSGFGRFDQSFKEIETVLKLSPGKQVVLLYKATLLENLGRTEEAFELFEYTFNLAPDNVTARTLYAAAAIKMGRYQFAEDLLKAAQEKNPDILIDDNVLNAYAKVERYDKVLEIWKQKAQKNPNNHQVAISLAAAYLKVGNTAEAIAQIRRAIEINPAIAAQGEALIRDIQAGKPF